MSRHVYVLFAICLFGIFACVFACGRRRQANAVSPRDSVAARKDSTISLPAAFVELRKAFEKDTSGHADPHRDISPALILSFRIADFDTAGYHSVSPVAAIENKAGYFYIIKGHCAAGGDCGGYFLLAFDKGGNFLKGEYIGQLAAEEDDIDDMHSVKEGDSVLLTYQVDHQLGEDGGKDTTITKLTHRFRLLEYGRKGN